MNRSLVLITWILCLGCAAEPTPVDDATSDPDIPDSVIDTEEADTEDATPNDTTPPPECTTHADCGFLFCDHGNGECVECLIPSHCPIAAPICTNTGCMETTPCTEDETCPFGLCDPGTGKCVDCLLDTDCPIGNVCHNQICSGPKIDCINSGDCSPYDLLCKPGVSLCVECLGDLHCPTHDHCSDAGDCTPDACPPNLPATNCDGVDLSICADNGSAWEAVPCPEGQACKDGVEGQSTAACTPLVCEAGAKVCSGFYEVTLCNATGTEEATYSCPSSTICEDGECKIPKPIILVAFDTSSSMWAYPDGGVPELCENLGKTCVDPWPICEGDLGGITYMGHSKSVFGALFAEFADKLHFGLLRFPQTVQSTPQPLCKSGYYQGQTTLSGDPDEHVADASGDGWFQTGLHQSLVVPLSTGTQEAHLEEILSWLDFTETLSDLGNTCSQDVDCDELAICVTNEGGGKTCHEHANPELRPVGQTPLGRTLFYAGEYLRQNVVIDGNPCEEDAECPTPFHSCVEGVCFDPGRNCRSLGIILFTDGTESVDPHLEDWFNPRNQAKRFNFGLGCLLDEDCLSGATCQTGVCQGPAGPPSGKSCLDTGQYCQADGDCVGGEGCVSNANTFTDPLGVQRLLDPAGNPITVGVSVVTVGTSASDASLIAANGGGDFFQITDANPEELLNALSSIISQKLAADCSGE